MGNTLEWANDYIKRYEQLVKKAGTSQYQMPEATTGTKLELYELAKAIISESNS